MKNIIIICMMLFPFVSMPNIESTHSDLNYRLVDHRQNMHVIGQQTPVFYDDFNSEFTAFNMSLWNLETFGNGGTSQLDGTYFNMSAARHAFRTISSKTTFSVGMEATIRIKMNLDELILCMGWTNSSSMTGWNYLFTNNSVSFQAALSTALIEETGNSTTPRRTKLLPGVDIEQFHDYRMVWNSTAMIAYVDGLRYAVIEGNIPKGPMHFKIALTEFRNQTTKGWVLIDSVSISPHTSLITEHPPFILLEAPGNNSLNLMGDEVQVTAVGSNGSIIYSWDGEGNNTAVIPVSMNFPDGTGSHRLQVWCKDGFGYEKWETATYTFETIETTPTISIAYSNNRPSIDGVLSDNEWDSGTGHELKMYWIDGRSMMQSVYLMHDGEFLYVGIDSPVASAHDSRAAVIVTGELGDTFQGRNDTPRMAIIANMGSPDAWSGYTETCYLEQIGEVIYWRKVIDPAGFAMHAEISERGVYYEFRLPLSEFDARTGSTLGFSVALFPSGIGVHHISYPLVNSWNDATRLGKAYLASPGNPLLIVVIIGSIGIVGLAGAVYWISKTKVAQLITDPSNLRILEIVDSYAEIPITRFSRMMSLPEEEVRDRIRNMIQQGQLNANYDEHEDIVRRN